MQATEPAELGALADHSVTIERLGGAERVQIRDANGELLLQISVTTAGAVVSLGRGAVTLHVDGDLAIEAERVSIRGEHGLELTSGADARIEVAGDLESEARIQSIRARLGDVKVRANDDVRLNGERIKLNC